MLVYAGKAQHSAGEAGMRPRRQVSIGRTTNGRIGLEDFIGDVKDEDDERIRAKGVSYAKSGLMIF